MISCHPAQRNHVILEWGLPVLFQTNSTALKIRSRYIWEINKQGASFIDMVVLYQQSNREPGGGQVALPWKAWPFLVSFSCGPRLYRLGWNFVSSITCFAFYFWSLLFLKFRPLSESIYQLDCPLLYSHIYSFSSSYPSSFFIFSSLIIIHYWNFQEQMMKLLKISFKTYQYCRFCSIWT